MQYPEDSYLLQVNIVTFTDAEATLEISEPTTGWKIQVIDMIKKVLYHYQWRILDWRKGALS